ncbi:MAG: DUF3800 domain-containing protein [Nitrospira sp.]|nr:DUF3800 domain-containing protein [Nitrospira sp.]
MLAFVDESGDAGLRPEKGASLYFTVALVTFVDHREAEACDRRIAALRSELRKPDGFEFHFHRNSHGVRMRFLEAVAPFGFAYHALTVSKDARLLGGNETFQGYTCRRLFETAGPHLADAIVVLDDCGEGSFLRELKRYLRDRAAADGQRLARAIRMERSRSNNLLQLADYVAGVVNRTACRKRGAGEYLAWIASREIPRQVWP